MKILIIKPEIAEKLRSIKFPKGNRLDPVKGFINGLEVEWLQADFKEVATFAEVLKDFESCEIKDITTVEQKYYDAKNVEILPTKRVIKGVETVKYLSSKGVEVDPMELTVKTVLLPSWQPDLQKP